MTADAHRTRYLSDRRWWVAAAIALGPIILIGRELLVGRVLFWGTPALQFVPWWTEGLRQLFTGSMPLWNFLNGMGAPLLANYQTAFFYPPNWLLFGFYRGAGASGLAWGFTFLAMLHLIWGGLGMAAFLRRLGASFLAQAVGGTAYALSGYWIGRLEFLSMVWVGAWIPWLLRYLDEIASPVKLKESRLNQKWLHGRLIIVLTMMLLAGHAQLSWYALELGGVWLAAGTLWGPGWRVLPRTVGRLISAGAVSGLLAAIQLIPTAEYLLQSQRASAVEYQQALVYSFWPWRLVTLLAPDFFGNPGKGNFWGYASYWEDHAYLGVLLLIFALGSLGFLFKKAGSSADGWLPKRLVIFLWVVIGVALVFSFGLYTPIFPWLYRHIPTFNMFQAPARTMIWLVLAVIILGADGIDRWRYPSGKGLYCLRLGTAGAFAAALGAGLGWVVLNNVKLTFIQATGWTGFWAFGVGILGLLTQHKSRPGWRIAWPCAVYAWVLVDLLTAGWLLNPTVPASFYDGIGNEITSLKTSLNATRVFLSQPDEYSIKFNRFLRFRDYRAYEDWANMKQVLLPNTNLFAGIALVTNFDPFVPERYSTWMNVVNRLPEEKQRNAFRLMNVGAVEKIDSTNMSGVRFIMLNRSIPAAVYSCVEIIKPGDDPLVRVARRGFSSFNLLVEGSSTTGTPHCDGTPPIISPPMINGGNSMLFDVAQKPGWLFISQVWYPGWRAWADGEEIQVYRADYAFMAVEIPYNAKKIVLQYRPNSYQVGALLSILMLIGLMLVFWLQRSMLRHKGILDADPTHRSE